MVETMSSTPFSRFTALENESLVLWEQGDRVFCRAWRSNAEGTQTAVLALRHAGKHPTPASLGRFAHEYTRKGDLDGAWAVRPLELVHEPGRTPLLLDDSGGERLDRLLGSPLELGHFLQLAIGIVTALGKAHQRGIIHMDISRPISW